MAAPKEVADLSRAEAEVALARLAAEIAHHDRLYYQDDAPEISDADYDALRRRNAEIEARFPDLVRADSPAGRVGAAPAGGFAKVKHRAAMLSLANAFDDAGRRRLPVERIRRFLRSRRRRARLDIVAEAKIDGLSMSLLYEDGHLVQGATRGDGSESARTSRPTCFTHRRICPRRLTRPDVARAVGSARRGLSWRRDDFQRDERDARKPPGSRPSCQPAERGRRHRSVSSTPKITAGTPADTFWLMPWGEVSEALGETQWDFLGRGLAKYGFPRSIEPWRRLCHRAWTSRAGHLPCGGARRHGAELPLRHRRHRLQGQTALDWQEHGWASSAARRAGRSRTSSRPSRRRPDA